MSKIVCEYHNHNHPAFVHNYECPECVPQEKPVKIKAKKQRAEAVEMVVPVDETEALVKSD
jgi:hypothetical protein